MTASTAQFFGTEDIRHCWRTNRSWNARLTADAERARWNQTVAQRHVTEHVLRRSLEAGALAVALTGSTARNCRTRISDLDYHVVGQRPDVSDLPGDVDIYASSEDRLWDKLRGGDDFVQWTLRCGCILFDAGIMRDALRCVVTEALWPDGEVKIARIPELVRLAQRLISIGDRDAAQDQVRAALTSAARGLLLRENVFPLSRRELPDQLETIGMRDLGNRLDDSIYRTLSLAQLEQALAPLHRLPPAVADR